MDIEKLATSTITDCIAGTDFLSPWISEGDREPSWDGFIYAYSQKSQAKQYLTGRAAVQVKGKRVKSLKKKSITYSVSMIDLENYRNDGGSLFFVVAITENLEKKIYYSALLPYKINQLMKIYDGKKKPSLTFAEFPTKKNEIENIVISFVKDCRKQAVVKNGKNWTIDEVEKLVGFDNLCLNFSVTCIGYDRNDPFPYMKNSDFYMYAGNKDKSIQFPIEHIENLEIVTYDKDIEISANNKVFYNRIKFEYRRDGTRITHIGKSIRMNFTEDTKATFKYELKGNLDERICSAEFMIAVYEDQGFCVDGSELHLDHIQQKINIDEVKKKLRYLKLVKEMLDKFGVSKSLDADNLTPKNEADIRMLINTQLYGGKAFFEDNKEIPSAGFIHIANIHLLIACTKTDDSHYVIENYFCKEIACSMDKTENTATSQYVLMSPENYLEADNFDAKRVEESFKKHHNTSHYSQTNFSILNMLTAYDKDQKREDLLILAEKLCEWLISEQPDDYVYQINLLQCHKRREKLTDQEIIKLNDISKEVENNDSLQAGIQILLDNYRLAKIYLHRLSEADRKEFESYPIYNLMKQEN